MVRRGAQSWSGQRVLSAAGAVRCVAALAVAAFGIGLAAIAQERPAAPSGGEALYQSRCAACHDHPSGRIPSKAAIAGETPNFIISALSNGVMKAQAAGLTRQEMASIAQYLSNNKTGGDVDHAGLVAPACASPAAPFSPKGPRWNGWGRDVGNTRYQPDPGLAAADVPRLKLKWAIAMPGDRNGQATLVGGRLFTNNTAGAVYALDARSGCLYWRFSADAGTRTTLVVGALPRIAGKTRYALYFADRKHDVYALNAETGALLWKTRIDDHPAVQMTGSPTFYRGVVYVPVSSAEEYLATLPGYPCCTFRGSLVAMEGATGKILWKTYTTAQPPRAVGKSVAGVTQYGPAGGAVWSAPTVDARRRLIYVGTGNSYTDVPFDGSDAVIAFDMATGAVRWVNQLDPKDNYVMGCLPGEKGGPNCPPEVGGDYDVGSSPILHDLPGGKQILLVGQKSSQVYGMDPDNGGKILWTQRLSAGGPLGGVEFGPAADVDTLYVAIADIYMRALARPGLTAIRISDGKILWRSPGTPRPCRWKNEYCDPAQSQAVSAMPGVVFSGAMNGHLRAYAANSGAVLWDFNTAGQSYRTLGGRLAEGGVLDAAGPTIADGMVYVHSGYAGRSGEAGTVLLAFSRDGR